MSTGNGGNTHKLWGGMFSVPTAQAMDALNRSIGTDFRLWPHDIKLSQAWATGLAKAGVLTDAESRQIVNGLAKVAEKFAAGAEPVATDEDIHTMIDRLLHDEVGDVASKLHTGRSRNDQVATATRMWTMAACKKLDESVRGLQQVMIKHAERLQSALMPAYTHLQRAQPVSVAHWMLNHFWPLERDRARIAAAAKSASVMPLGSGAIAGSAYPIPRKMLQESLGFADISPNSIDAVGDRDFIADTLYAVTMLGTHLSRLSEDLILFGSSEFKFIRFGEAFTTGSSMMPQKRNPDALELARASSARSLGELTALVATVKGLPSGYNKDLQDDKRALFAAVDNMLLVVPAVAGTLDEITFLEDKMRAALSSTMMATDLADYLVSKRVSFREAHGVVGSLVRKSEESGVEMHEMPFDTFSAAHKAFEKDVFDWLTASGSAERRKVPGGTASEAVKEQLEAAKKLVASL